MVKISAPTEIGSSNSNVGALRASSENPTCVCQKLIHGSKMRRRADLAEMCLPSMLIRWVKLTQPTRHATQHVITSNYGGYHFNGLVPAASLHK